MIDALKLIIARSPQAGSTALECIRAVKASSPVLQHRYNRTVEYAFSDPNAKFAAEERELIASYVESEDGGPKTLELRIRVNASEKAQIQRMAKDGDLTVSDFIRERIGL